MTNFIGVYDNVISLEECNYYINLIEKSDKKAGKIHNYKNQIIEDSSIKISEDLCISIDYPEEVNRLLKLFSNYINIYEKENNVFIPMSKAEYIKGRVYRKNKGHFKLHIDTQCQATSSRTLSILLFLNNVNKGGELSFPLQNKVIQSKAGRLILFPPNWMFQHKASIPLDTDRYIINSFMRL